MRKSTLFISALSVVALASCRKDVPLADPTSPDFYVNALVDGVEESVIAGDEGYYMYTDYEFPEDHAPQMVGELRSSSEGLSSWKFEFTNNSTDEEIDLESVLALGDKSLTSSDIVQNKSILNIKPKASFGAETSHMPSYYWRYQHGASIPVINPVFTFDSTNYSGKQPIVTIGSRFYNQYDIETSRCVDILHPDDWAAFEVEVVQPGVYIFYLAPQFSSQINQVYWDINGAAAGQGDTLFYRHPNGNIGSKFFVTAGFRHANGARTCESREVVLLDSDLVPPNMDFQYKVESGMTIDSLQLNKVNITYTTASGTVYTTSMHSNPGTVSIQEVTDYVNDAEGRPTVKLIVSGSFLLQDATGDELRIDNAEFVIAVATSDP